MFPEAILNWKKPMSVPGFEPGLPRENAVALPLVPPPLPLASKGFKLPICPSCLRKHKTMRDLNPGPPIHEQTALNTWPPSWPCVITTDCSLIWVIVRPSTAQSCSRRILGRGRLSYGRLGLSSVIILRRCLLTCSPANVWFVRVDENIPLVELKNTIAPKTALDYF